MNTKKSLDEIIRDIQESVNTNTEEACQDYSFYKGLNQVIQKVFVPGAIENLIPINLGICSIERAMQLAYPMGLIITQGKSGIVYIGWSKGLDYDD